MKKYISILLCFSLFFSCKKNEQDINITKIYDNEQFHLQGVDIVNDTTVIAVGGIRYDFGIKLISRNSGNTWLQEVLENKTIYDVAFKNNKTYAVGYDSKLMHSYDTLRSYNFYQGWIWQPLHSLAVWSSGEVIVVGGVGYEKGIIYRSYNNTLDYVLDTIQNELRDVSVTGENSAVAVGYGIVQYTEDKGNSWTYADIEGDFFKAIHFPNSIVGYAIGYQGTIIKTIDKGKTWKKLRNGNNLTQRKWNLQDIFFVNDLEGFAVGDNGLVVRTTNGGKDWQYVESNTKKDLHALVIKNNVGYIVGEDGIILKFQI